MNEATDIDRIKNTLGYQWMLHNSALLDVYILVLVELAKNRFLKRFLSFNRTIDRMIKLQKKYLEYQSNPYLFINEK